jgi:hypothetical protein
MMMIESETPVLFDESCAQEVAPAPRLAAATPRTQPPQDGNGRLERLDLLMWALCFWLGVFFARTLLPAIESRLFPF